MRNKNAVLIATMMLLVSFQNCSPVNFSPDQLANEKGFGEPVTNDPVAGDIDDGDGQPTTPPGDGVKPPAPVPPVVKNPEVPPSSYPGDTGAIVKKCVDGLKTAASSDGTFRKLGISSERLEVSGSDVVMVEAEEIRNSVSTGGSSSLYLKAGYVRTLASARGSSEMFASLGSVDEITGGAGSALTCVEANSVVAIQNSAGSATLFVRGKNAAKKAGSEQWNPTYTGNSNIYLENAQMGDLSIQGSSNVVLKGVELKSLSVDGSAKVLLIDSHIGDFKSKGNSATVSLKNSKYDRIDNANVKGAFSDVK